MATSLRRHYPSPPKILPLAEESSQTGSPSKDGKSSVSRALPSNQYCLCTLSQTIVTAAALALLQMVAVLGTTYTLKAVSQTQMAHLASLAKNHICQVYT